MSEVCFHRFNHWTTAFRFASTNAKENTKENAKENIKEAVKESKDKEQTASATEGPKPGSTDPIKPNSVKTVTVHPGTMRTASLSPLPPDNRKLMPSATAATSITTVNTVKSETPPGAKPGVLGVLSSKVASASDSVPVASVAPEPDRQSRRKAYRKSRAPAAG